MALIDPPKNDKTFYIAGGDDLARRKEKEDKIIGKQAKMARYLKHTGRVPKDAHIKIGELDVDKNLPPIEE